MSDEGAQHTALIGAKPKPHWRPLDSLRPSMVKQVFSREQLLDGVWGSGIYIDERTVDVHVGRLRKAINRGRMADPIRTVRGTGYALDDQFGRQN